MSDCFDLVRRALNMLRDADNLTKSQRDLIIFSQDVIASIHNKNDDLNNVINDDLTVIEATQYLEGVMPQRKTE